MQYTVREKYVSEGTTFDMDEDSVIVGRRPHLTGVKLLIAEPGPGTSSPVCGAPTHDGEGRCGRTVDEEGARCWQHE